MKLNSFIRVYRQDIDEAIRQSCPNCRHFNDSERRQWVLNDESLYMWARSEGVRI